MKYEAKNFFNIDCHPDDSRYLDFIAERANALLKEWKKEGKEVWFGSRLGAKKSSCSCIGWFEEPTDVGYVSAHGWVMEIRDL